VSTLFRIGCAGWSIPRSATASFPAEGSHLQRYAARFNAVEINSSFYRPHRRSTYERWAASTPDDFAFSVKLPNTITHAARLVSAGKLLDTFFAEIDGLGEKLGCVLVQLPPSFRFERRAVRRFLKVFRTRHDGAAAIEPRHVSWFDAPADETLLEFRFGRAGTDPALTASAATPSADRDVAYFRLHGSPKIYYSDYSDVALRGYAKQLRVAAKQSREVWCIFDNTALGFAANNAVSMQNIVHKSR
jgi:uncharacterized protein YecE (DUF72 family)